MSQRPTRREVEEVLEYWRTGVSPWHGEHECHDRRADDCKACRWPARAQRIVTEYLERRWREDDRNLAAVEPTSDAVRVLQPMEEA